MNELKVFDNPEFGEIRVVEVNGNPWFCLADVCRPLGLQAYKCRSRLKEKGILTMDTLTSGGVQGMLYCDEGNLYRAIFQSKKPEAEQFTDWVTDEVLPALHKQGRYILQGGTYAPAPDVSPAALARLITITRRAMMDMGSKPAEVGKMVNEVFQTWNVPVSIPIPKQIPEQLTIEEAMTTARRQEA